MREFALLGLVIISGILGIRAYAVESTIVFKEKNRGRKVITPFSNAFIGTMPLFLVVCVAVALEYTLVLSPIFRDQWHIIGGVIVVKFFGTFFGARRGMRDYDERQQWHLDRLSTLQ